MPSHSVSIRSIEREKYKVMDHEEKEIEEIEESKAFFQVKHLYLLPLSFRLSFQLPPSQKPVKYFGHCSSLF